MSSSAALPKKSQSSDEILARFCPSNQVACCRNEERALFGNAPTIRHLEAQFGFSTAVSWLEVQLNDLSEFAGCREKINPARCRELAGMMASDYPHYRLTEFMLFFQRFKRCHYGKFYGAVDPMAINGALLEFDRDRRMAIHRRREEERRQQEREEDARKHLRRDRYRSLVPNAFTDEALIDFTQYDLMDFHQLTDTQIAWTLEQIRNGQLKLPNDLQSVVFYDSASLRQYICDNAQ